MKSLSNLRMLSAHLLTSTSTTLPTTFYTIVKEQQPEQWQLSGVRSAKSIYINGLSKQNLSA